MPHNVKEFEIRDGLTASYDLKTGRNVIFRVVRKDTPKKWALLANGFISEHEQFGVQECYTEATMTKDTSIEDFRVLYEDLKYHITWFRHTFDGDLYPYIIDETYFKNRYGTKAKLRERAKKLNKLKFSVNNT